MTETMAMYSISDTIKRLKQKYFHQLTLGGRWLTDGVTMVTCRYRIDIEQPSAAFRLKYKSNLAANKRPGYKRLLIASYYNLYGGPDVIHRRYLPNAEKY